MPGREFLELARELLLLGKLPRHWRAVIIHAYYGLLLEYRDAMTRQQMHAQVRLRLVYSSDPGLKAIGYKLEELGKHRNSASYDLQPLLLFSSATAAQDDIKAATDALALLDATDADPARRAKAVASIKP